MQEKLEIGERCEFATKADTVTAYSCYALFLLNLVSAQYLIRRLQLKKKQSEQCQTTQSIFDKEIRSLYFILGVFSVSYLLRGLYN